MAPARCEDQPVHDRHHLHDVRGRLRRLGRHPVTRTLVAVLAWRPSRRGLVTAVAAAVAALPLAWLIAEATRTGSW